MFVFRFEIHFLCKFNNRVSFAYPVNPYFLMKRKKIFRKTALYSKVYLLWKIVTFIIENSLSVFSNLAKLCFPKTIFITKPIKWAAVRAHPSMIRLAPHLLSDDPFLFRCSWDPIHSNSKGFAVSPPNIWEMILKFFRFSSNVI
jgi:hypothetical protein